jgi:hypothetical protein
MSDTVFGSIVLAIFLVFVFPLARLERLSKPARRVGRISPGLRPKADALGFEETPKPAA